MKKILLLILGFYQGFASAFLKSILGVDRMCRLSPTCSEYSRLAISKKGVIEGLRESAVRILRCQPFIKF